MHDIVVTLSDKEEDNKTGENIPKDDITSEENEGYNF